MIEKIGTEAEKWTSTPCKEVMDYLDKLLEKDPPFLTVSEIGVGVGATSVEIVKRLRKQDSYHFFSFSDEVDELFEDLKKLGCKCNLVPFGNSRKTYDSYCWPLAKLALEIDPAKGLYDLCYLDGGHNLNWTGLGCALLKNLIKPGGYLIFDDLPWSYGKSHDMNPEVFPEILDGYTEEQINTAQIQMVVDIFMEKDAEWVCEKLTNQRAVYRKLLEEKGKKKSLRKWFNRQRQKSIKFMSYCKGNIPSSVKDFVRSLRKF